MTLRRRVPPESCRRPLLIVPQEEGYADSAFGTDKSDTTSVSSSIYEGYIENGRRYQTKREGEYWGPSDEKQVSILTDALGSSL